jgi:hypothetical protein
MYVLEIWNPPEARGASLHRSTATHMPTMHTRAVQHIVMTRTRRMPAKTPDLSDIPRQITPEGNVLRVDSRNTTAEVTR